MRLVSLCAVALLAGCSSRNIAPPLVADYGNTAGLRPGTAVGGHLAINSGELEHGSLGTHVSLQTGQRTHLDVRAGLGGSGGMSMVGGAANLRWAPESLEGDRVRGAFGAGLGLGISESGLYGGPVLTAGVATTTGRVRPVLDMTVQHSLDTAGYQGTWMSGIASLDLELAKNRAWVRPWVGVHGYVGKFETTTCEWFWSCSSSTDYFAPPALGYGVALEASTTKRNKRKAGQGDWTAPLHGSGSDDGGSPSDGRKR